MQEILAYLNKVTFGLLRPQASRIETYKRMIAYNVNHVIDVHINGVFAAKAKVEKVGVGTGRNVFVYWELARMHVSLLRQIRKLQRTDGVLQFVVDGSPVATQTGHDIWDPWREIGLTWLHVAFGTYCLELHDERFQDLCRKFWNT